MPDASTENHPLLPSLSRRPVTTYLLTEVLTQLGEGVAILAADGTILCWNPRMTSLTGYTASEANARGWIQLFDLSPRLTQVVEQAKGGLPTAGECLTLKCANGSHQPVMLWCIPMPSTEDTETQVLAVLREVTTATSRPAEAHAKTGCCCWLSSPVWCPMRYTIHSTRFCCMPTFWKRNSASQTVRTVSSFCTPWRS